VINSDKARNCFAIYRSGVRIPYSPAQKKPAYGGFFLLEENRGFEAESAIRAVARTRRMDAPRADGAGPERAGKDAGERRANPLDPALQPS
jgi:hypothetical protein